MFDLIFSSIIYELSTSVKLNKCTVSSFVYE